jgi:16S rRNA (guanine527-N7)-methyltransferase
MPVAARLADGLADGLVALGEQGSVSARVEEKLRRYLALLTKWNRVYNLTAITEPEQMITHHVLDSLAIAAPLDLLLARTQGARVLDVGSGAGLPGIPLAIARPAWQLTLLDGNSKRTAFIAQAAAEIGLSNVTVVTARAESFVSAPFDVIVSRAFASLRDFVTNTKALLGPAGYWAAMKGGVPHDELRELPSAVECRDVRRLQIPGLDAERHLLLLKVKTE